MEWFKELINSQSVAHTVFLYSLVIAVGVSLGKVKFGGISLGITFVLFAGIIMGHFGLNANHIVIDFVKDFGLILFVFSIGLQVGPGFFSSFKRGGLTLNLLAGAIVISGALVTLVIHFITGTPLPVMAGIMSGAVTNTPGLGAAQQAMAQVYPDAGTSEMSLGYAVAYPFGVLGIILTMLILRRTFKINVSDELERYNEDINPSGELPERISIQVTNPSVFGRNISEVTEKVKGKFVISRIFHNGEIIAACSESTIMENDIILVVTQKEHTHEIVSQIGVLSSMDLSSRSGSLVSRQILVTNQDVFGRKLGTLKLRNKYNINITRLNRAGIELIASPGIRLQMGDKLTVVGDEGSLGKVSQVLGNSLKRLNEPNIVPIFIGILLGVILGSIPVKIPGIVNPLKLGLAGGPLIVAILMSKYGHKLQLSSYTTPSANLMLREIGIVLFLASVGITAGEKFIPTLISGDGFIWMAYGAIITLVPILIIGFYARFFLKRNYLEICGLLAGSMTDPPALAFANNIAQSEAPAVAYATVYPLVMFMRIFLAQLILLLFM